MSFNPYEGSNDYKRRNPHLFKHPPVTKFEYKDGALLPVLEPKPKPAKRIRQSQKPLLNKLEQEWFDLLKSKTSMVLKFTQNTRYEGRYESLKPEQIRAQSKRYQIANGTWYKPDITASWWAHQDSIICETAWEVKGPRQMKGIARGMVVLKAAAHQWPEVRFILVWKEKGEWKEQTVLP